MQFSRCCEFSNRLFCRARRSRTSASWRRSCSRPTRACTASRRATSRRASSGCRSKIRASASGSRSTTAYELLYLVYRHLTCMCASHTTLGGVDASRRSSASPHTPKVNVANRPERSILFLNAQPPKVRSPAPEICII